MAAPYSGPISKGQTTPAIAWQRTGQRQSRPLTDVLPMRYGKGEITALRNASLTPGSASSYLFYMDTWATNSDWNRTYNQTLAMAHDRFSSSVQDRAALGVDVAEYHQSLQMMVNAATRVGAIAAAVRKRDLNQLYKALTPEAKSIAKAKNVKLGKVFANNFLEVHFGWVPLAQDLHDAAHAISQPLKAPAVHSSASASQHRQYGTDAGGGYFTRFIQDAKFRSKMGASVKVSNPALHLASSLGVTNPLAIAWELVPFSFVVDWFSNVGQFVGQLDEFAGLSLEKAYTTTSCNASGTQDQGNPNWTPPTNGWTWKNVAVTRNSGIASVPLTLKPLKLPSPVRAATAVSLMIQKLL